MSSVSVPCTRRCVVSWLPLLLIQPWESALSHRTFRHGWAQTRVWLLDCLTLFICINHSLLQMLSLSVALKLFLNLHDAQISGYFWVSELPVKSGFFHGLCCAVILWNNQWEVVILEGHHLVLTRVSCPAWAGAVCRAGDDLSVYTSTGDLLGRRVVH